MRLNEFINSTVILNIDFVFALFRPSYREYRETVFYFFSFITLGAFGVLNLVLIIVLVQFQRSNQQASDYQTATRQVLLIRAFAVMDYERNGYVDKKDIQLLFTELYTHYSDFRKNRPPQRAAATELLAEILDVDGDGKITVDDFLFFLDVARLKLSTETKKTFLEIHYPSITNSNLFQGLKTLVYSWKFDFGVDTLVAVMIIILFSIKANELYTHNAATETILVLLLLTFMLEATLKIMVKGVKNYFRHMRNQMDFTITVLLLVIFLIAASVGRLFTDSRDVDGLVIAIRVLQVSRLLLYPRNIRYIPSVNRHSKFARILKRIFQKIYTVSIIFFCSGYVFASIGAYAYGGLISPVPGVSPNYDALASSLYGQGDYYQINCNDFLSAVMMLCIAIHVSDFNVLATGFVAVTDKYSRLYFLVWYCVGVLLMLNIVKSFFLGEFLVFFTVSSSNAAAADTADSSGRGEVANGGLTGSRSVSTASGYEGGLGRSSRNNSGVGLSGRIDNIKDTDSRGKTGAGNRARLNLTADEDGIANSKSREATESSITYGTFTRDSPKLPQSWKHAHQPIKRNNSYYNTNSARHSGVGASGLMAGLGIHHRSESETSLDSLALSEMSGIDRSGLDGMVEILDREIFILEIQPHKKRSADNGGSNSLSSMVETPVLNALVENAGSEPIEQSLEQSAGIEPLQIDATGTVAVVTFCLAYLDALKTM